MFKEAESRPDKIESTSNNVQVSKKHVCEISVVGHRLHISDLKHARKLTFGMSVCISGTNTIHEYCHV